MDITVVDYGAGNLRSAYNAFWRLGADVEITSDPDVIANADRLVLPGVGAASWAIEELSRRNLDQALRTAVFERGRPFLGICVGMQILAEELTEYGERPGLGWIPGRVSLLRPRDGAGEHLPHMGWSDLTVATPEGLSGDLAGREYYFCHSYALAETDEDKVLARADAYGGFVAAVQFDTVLAVQFHPEKSQVAGEEMLERFLEWAP